MSEDEPLNIAPPFARDPDDPQLHDDRERDWCDYCEKRMSDECPICGDENET